MNSRNTGFSRPAACLLAFLLTFNLAAAGLLAEAGPASGLAARADRLKQAQSGIQAAADTTEDFYEAEPNDSFDTANLLSGSYLGEPEYFVFGAMDSAATDIDHYSLSVPEAGTLDLLGIWLSDAVVDAGLENFLLISLFDASKKPVASARLVTGESAAYRSLVTAVGPGTYFIAVSQDASEPSQFIDQTYGMALNFTPAGVPAVYQVTFDSQGGTALGMIEAASGSLIAAPAAPVRTGFTFAGWYRDPACTVPWNFAIDTVLEDTMLYARWLDMQAEAGIRDFIVRFYQLCLGRTPDQGGLDYWAGQLRTGARTGASVAAGFVMSPEFEGMDTTSQAYVTIMYRAFFDREPDQAGMAHWLGQMDSGMSRFWVLAGFVNSLEFQGLCNDFGIMRGSLALTAPADLHPQLTAFVTRFYKLTLERMPDEEGLNHWVGSLATGASTGAALAERFIFSQEFTSRNVPDSQFIDIMYSTFFNRTPDAGGVSFWTSQLAAGQTRRYVLAGFVHSQEFGSLCDSYGIQRGDLAPMG